jgi:hypothetical protein
MSGIVGFSLKDRALEARLGFQVANGPEALTDQRPDSAGFAVHANWLRATCSDLATLGAGRRMTLIKKIAPPQSGTRRQPPLL